MKALDYLNEVITNKSARVPDALVDTVVTAGLALGFIICGGFFNPETDTRVLYIA